MAESSGWLSVSSSTATVTSTVSVTSSATSTGGCWSTTLPASGVVSILNNPPVTLSNDAVFMYNCPTAAIEPSAEVIEVTPLMMANGGINLEEATSGPEYNDLRDPFYMTTFPIFYVLAATTMLAYMLVIMLFITPRSFVNGGVVYLGRQKGFTTGSAGVAFGQRPWLQKVAALTVALSLTIASGTSFTQAESQYHYGIVQNAQRLQKDVMDGTPLKVIRLISDTVLWLAQAQTLLHLFPRHRQRTIITWAAFALITLELIFSALNSFVYRDNGSSGNMRPRSFVDAIPALSYLFQLTMGLLYAAWVIYYAVGKRRYAFYHPLMKNMWLVALIALIAILVPVVFFIIDIANPRLAGWGDYVRWVGAAAASVMVWEWAERIETLEGEEKKDGILGRQVFDDADDPADSSPDHHWRERKGRNGTSIGNGFFPPPPPSQTRQSTDDPISGGQLPTTIGDIMQPGLWPLRPRPTVTPVSRTDTGSISTVYVMRQHHPHQQADSRGQTPEIASQPVGSPSRSNSSARSRGMTGGEEALASANPSRAAIRSPIQTASPAVDVEANDHDASSTARSRNRWRALAQLADPLSLLSGKSQGSRAVVSAPESATQEKSPSEDAARWDFRSKLQNFAVSQAEKIQSRIKPQPDVNKFPIRVVAPPTRGAALEQVDEEGGNEDGTPGREARSSAGSEPGRFRQYTTSTRRSTSLMSSHSRQLPAVTTTRDPTFVPPPPWPGVPRDSYSSYDESSRGGSFESIRSGDSRRAGSPPP